MRLIRTLMLSAVLLGSTAAFAADGGHSVVDALIESASTPAQHKALADHYRDAAEEARKQAANHERMATRYGTTKNGANQKPHCEKIASDLTDMATQYDALAKAEDALAK